ncbi:pyrimidine reductase family protein [Rathayibacter soli]|uniref:pyrimidine reductase family protein n=1 Tax=Rathayibacter soli TaxID=3144168 RepID=UPI0027E57592|nr:pyrimidine reductase family protein [Glaciibacter superstes]
MSDAAITRIWPLPTPGPGASLRYEEASDDDLVAWYSAPNEATHWARVNFVASIDGAATHEGRSAGLSDAADHRVFDLLRTLCHVVVVGAGTVRTEGYGPMRVAPAAEARRLTAGLAPQPVFALVSASLNLDPKSRIFTDAPVRPIVVTTAASPADRRAALAEVADVLVCGEDDVDTAWMLRALAERGLTQVHCEGGPRLFGTMLADGTLDELCLTVSPLLEGGAGPGITGDVVPDAPMHMRLAHALAAGDTLLLRYLRA